MYKQLRTIYKLTAIIPFPLMFILLLLSFATSARGQEQGALGFTRIAEGGFWEEDGVTYDPHNNYTWSMAWFKGKLYVGTNRDILALRKIQANQPNGKPLPDMDPFPVEYVPDSPLWFDDNENGIVDPGEGLDTRAEIWRYTPGTEPPETGEWEMVYQSPWVEVTTATATAKVAREYGYRNMVVFEEADGTEALYVNTSIITGDGPCILRTTTGDKDDFQVVAKSWDPQFPGVVPGSIISLRGLVGFKGKLYTAPLAKSFTDSLPIYESSENPENPNSVWRPVSLPGFGDPYQNRGVFEMAVFNGFLYAATLNPFEGLQVWKTAANEEDYDPVNKTYTDWQKVIDKGAYRDPGSSNETALSMYPFKGSDGIERLYVGLGIQSGGHDIGPIDPGTGEPEWDIGPDMAELIRINSDDTWDLIAGNARDTLDGHKEPISGMGPGFGDYFTAYFWRMAEFDGWLYVGTADNSVFTQYVTELPPAIVDWLNDPEHPEHTIEYILENTGGFDLWKTDNGVNWYPITWTGFGNPRNVGVRGLVSVPEIGLFLGTSNLFTDDVPEGGCQVWLGIPGTLRPPTNLQANFGALQVKLRWTPSPDAQQYRIIRHTGLSLVDNRGKKVIIYQLPPPEPIGITEEYFYVDTTVEQGKNYLYYVKADSGHGISDPSNPRGGKADDIFFPMIPGRFIFNRATRQFVQRMTIINETPATLQAPVPIVLEGLTPNVILVNQKGRAENGSPFLYATPNIPGNGGSVQILLRFNNPTFARIQYVPFVVWGPGAVP